ncbi:hypothetical protein A3Q32_03195 [Alcanivorax sp. KX64203]|nr:hypothetical protein A3Q32_03195 [Alcanivorax sp. KX64203]
MDAPKIRVCRIPSFRRSLGITPQPAFDSAIYWIRHDPSTRRVPEGWPASVPNHALSEHFRESCGSDLSAFAEYFIGDVKAPVGQARPNTFGKLFDESRPALATGPYPFIEPI